MNADQTGLRVPSPGESQRCVCAAAPNLPVWIYRPRHEISADRVIVVVHGISRASHHLFEQFKGLADRMGCTLLAPEFSPDEFPAYQTLGQRDAFSRSDLALNAFITAWQDARQQVAVRSHLYGYSGGAQFAHRYALLYPARVLSLAITSPGWYTCPDRAAYPYGLKDWPVCLGQPDLSGFLDLPILVMVGEQDTQRDSSLRKGKRLDRQQGPNRLVRARTWVAAVVERQQLQGATRPVQLQILPDQGHDFLQNAQQSDMLERIFVFWRQCEKENPHVVKNDLYRINADVIDRVSGETRY